MLVQCVSLLVSLAAAHADLNGRFAFNWAQDPTKAKCEVIGKSRLDEFRRDFTCDLTERPTSASGKSHVVCTAKKGAVEFLIFKSKADCQSELETQTANGP